MLAAAYTAEGEGGGLLSVAAPFNYTRTLGCICNACLVSLDYCGPDCGLRKGGTVASGQWTHQVPFKVNTIFFIVDSVRIQTDLLTQ